MNNGIQATVYGQAGMMRPDGNIDFSAHDRKSVNFYQKAVHDPEESKRRGRPWSKSTTYVRIQEPGEKDYVDRPVAEDDIAKSYWPRQWEQFLRKQEQVPQGTPVECLFPESPEIAANLHSIAIHTIQQLAGLTAHGMQTVGMGAQQWQDRAKQFLAAANGGVGMHRLNAENEKLKNAVEVLQNQNAMMKGQLDLLMAERRQGVAPNMLPPQGATLAQAHAASVGAYVPSGLGSASYADDPDGQDEPAPAAISSGPLFHEVADDSADDAPDIISPPRRGPGRPPKART